MSQVRTNSLIPAAGIPAGANGGGIIQIASVNKTDQYFQTGTGTPTDVPGLSVSITPQSASNKILVLGHVNFSAGGGGGDSFARLMRGGTSIGNGGDGFFAQVAGQDYFAVNQGIIYVVDSPGTTSSTTYKIQCWGQALYVNGRGFNGAFITSSQIVVLEVSG